MIELTEQQMQALESPAASPIQIVHPRTNQTFILLPMEAYNQLIEQPKAAVEYDDSPWTKEERHALAWESGKAAGWDEDWDEYDNPANEK